MQKYAKYFGLVAPVGLLINVVIYFMIYGTADVTRVLLVNSLCWLIGGQSLFAGLAHIFWSRATAESIGWRPSPFQFEVGMANLGLGVAGILAGSYDKTYWLALIIVASVFLWGAAVGHIREMIQQKNFSANNAGPIFWTDVLSPAWIIILYNML